jgi:hypothetical protein
LIGGIPVFAVIVWSLVVIHYVVFLVIGGSWALDLKNDELQEWNRNRPARGGKREHPHRLNDAQRTPSGSDVFPSVTGSCLPQGHRGRQESLLQRRTSLAFAVSSSAGSVVEAGPNSKRLQQDEAEPKAFSDRFAKSNRPGLRKGSRKQDNHRAA